MINLSTGAVLDKDLELTDYVDGRRYGPKVGWLITFIPCDYCQSRCRRNSYGICAKEYRKAWKAKFLNGQNNMVLENWGGGDHD